MKLINLIYQLRRYFFPNILNELNLKITKNIINKKLRTQKKGVRLNKCLHISLTISKVCECEC